MSLLNLWRVVITATQTFDYIWRDDTQGAPTVSSDGDPIDLSKSRIVQTYDPNEVKIKQENTPTGGHYRCVVKKYISPANTTTTHTTTFPYNINVLSTEIVTTSDMTGDTMKWSVCPNTTIGTLTADVSSGVSILDVSSTVIENISVGFEVRLALSTDPTNTYEDLGYVIDVDTVNSQITVQNPTTLSWSASSPPTLVQMTISYMEGDAGNPAQHVFGQSSLGTAYLPANYPIYCYYTNNSPTDEKTMYVTYQFLY